MSSNGNIFHITGLCQGNLLVTSGSPSQRPVTRNFDVFFDLHLNKQLSKQSRHWRVKMPSCSLWCHCNANKHQAIIHQTADPITFKCMIILNVCLMFQLLNKNKKLSKKNGCWWTQCLSIWGMVISSKQYGLRLVLWVVWLRDWSRSGGSYGNNTRVICCPAPGRPESTARGTSPPDNKSRGCCCRNSRPTVINPDYNMTKQRYITRT